MLIFQFSLTFSLVITSAADSDLDTIYFTDEATAEAIQECRQTSIRSYVEQNPLPTFHEILAQLERSPTAFLFTTDTTLIASEEETLGAIVAKGADSIFIVVPHHRHGTKGKLLDLFGGHQGLVAEEVFHAFQFIQGKIVREGHNGLTAASDFSEIMLDVEAKHFAALSGLADLQTSTYFPENSIPTLMGVVQSMNGNREKIRNLLIFGMSMDIPPKGPQEGRTTVHYRPAYDD